MSKLQAKFDAENEAGYAGIAPDDTPNEAYTVAGVTGGAAEAAPEPDGATETTETEPEAPGAEAESDGPSGATEEDSTSDAEAAGESPE